MVKGYYLTNCASLSGEAIKISVVETSFSNYSWVVGKSAFLKNLTLGVLTDEEDPAPLNIKNSL